MVEKETYAVEISIKVKVPGNYGQRTLATYDHDQAGLANLDAVQSLMDQGIPAGEAHIRECLARHEQQLWEEAEAAKAKQAREDLLAS